MAKQTGRGPLRGVECECGQLFNSQTEYNKHIASGECPAHGVIQIQPEERKTEVEVKNEKVEAHEELLEARALAKEVQEAKDQILSQAQKIREAAMAQDSIIIPYSMCSDKIKFLPKTRPVFLTVECLKTDIGLRVKSVKPGYK